MYLPYPSYGNNGNASNGSANNQQNNSGSQNSVTGQSSAKGIHPAHPQYQTTQPGNYFPARTSQSPVPPLGAVNHRSVLSSVNSTSPLALPHPNAVPSLSQLQQQQQQNQQNQQQNQPQQQYLAPSQFQQQVSPQNQHQQMYQQQSPKQKQQYDYSQYAQQQQYQPQQQQIQNQQQNQQHTQQLPQGKEKKPKQKRMTKKQLQLQQQQQQQQALEEARQEQIRQELEAQAQAQARAQAQAQAQVQALQVMQSGEKKRRGRPKKLILDPTTNQYIDSTHPNFKHLNKIIKDSSADLLQTGTSQTDHHYAITGNQTTINPSATTTTAPIPVQLPVQVSISNGKAAKPEKELTPDLSRLFDQPTYLRNLNDPTVQNLIQKKDRRGRPRKFPVEQTGVTIKGIRVNGTIKTTNKVAKK